MKQNRVPRSDGENTRAKILETAGQLFAERGYADTTSKAICEQAKTNMAAVNYHFGSRDGLYRALLHEVHKHLVSHDRLTRLVNSSASPQEKLEHLIDELIAQLAGGVQSWHARLWVREILTPSPFFADFIRDEAMPKFTTMTRLLSEVSGIPVGEAALTRCVWSVLAPCLMMLVINRDVASPVREIYQFPSNELAAHMKVFAAAGLAAIAAERQRNGN